MFNYLRQQPKQSHRPSGTSYLSAASKLCLISAAMLANNNTANGLKIGAKLKTKQGDNESEIFEKAFVDLDDEGSDNVDQQMGSLASHQDGTSSS